MAAKFFRGAEFKTPTGRLSFAQSLFKPRAAEQGGREKYGCTLIFPNTDKPAFEKALVEVLENQWPKDGIDRFKRGLIKSPILAGDGKEAHNKTTGTLNPGMGADVFFLRTSATVEFPPAVRWRSAPRLQAPRRTAPESRPVRSHRDRPGPSGHQSHWAGSPRWRWSRPSSPTHPAAASSCAGW